MAVEDIENKVRKMSSQKPEDGKDLQQLQEAQNQIVQINAERQGNLQTARLENNADAANNETMSQAVEMAALGGLGGGASVQQQVQSMNPQTQAVLGKYGLGQPKVQRTSSRSVQVTPQKITINNNTTNTTTNNVAVPAANIGGPVQGRTLAVKQNPDEGQARFKTWIANAFAKQNQQAAVREKEYQRREWSLTRSTNKLMKHLSDLGKSVSERLDPRKLSSSVGSQFKTILFLFGTMFLAKHWKRIIRFAGNVETFFFGEPNPNDPKAPRGRSGFSKMLISLFGGDPNSNKSSISDSFFKLFWNGESEKTGKGAGIFNILLKKIKDWFEIRGEAIKALKPPQLDLNNIAGSLQLLIGYVGDIFKTMLLGPKGAKESISNEIRRSSVHQSINNNTFKKGNDVIKMVKGENNVAQGTSDITRNYLTTSDVDQSTGKLKNNVTASIAQANTIKRFIEIANRTGEVNVTPVLQGLQNLKDIANDNGGKTLVNPSTLIGLFDSVKNGGKIYSELQKSGDISVKKYKYIIRPRTDEEVNSIINPEAQLLGDLILDSAIDSRAGSALLDANSKRDKFGHIMNNLVFGSKLTNINDYANNKEYQKLVKSTEVLDLVPEDTKLKQGWRLPDSEEYKKSIYLAEITPKVLDKVLSSWTKDSNSKINIEDTKYLEEVQAYLESKAKLSGHKIVYNDGENLKNKLKLYDNLDKKEQQLKLEQEEQWKNSNVKKSYDYISEGVSDAVDSVRGKLGLYNDIERGDFVRMMREAYSKKFKELGIDEKYIDYMVAQDAQESGWGTSNLATKNNNFGGIKDGDNWRKFDSLDDYVNYKVNLLNKDQYGYNAFNGDDIDTVMNRIASKYDPGNDKYVGRWKDTYNSVSKIKPLSTEEIKALRNQGKYTEADLASSSWERIEDVLKAGGVTDFVVTSKKRKPGEAGNSGNKSYHTTDNLAIDIVPTDGDFERLKQQLLSSPLVQEYFQRRELGILDETTKEALAKTGGTGAHYHIGPDNASVNTWLAWNKDFESSSNNDGVYYADNYVEKKTDKGFNIPTYNWGESGSNSSSSAVLMAQSNVLAPEKVTPTTPTSEKSIPGNTSESAGRELIADAEKDKTEDLYIKVSDINENIKLLSKTSIAQAEAINNVSTAIASLKFGGNINMGGGDGRTKVQSITTPPYRG